MIDAVVVGGGPAGLAAATWLGRYRKQVVVLDSGEQRNRWVDAAHGYLGRDPTSPMDLLAAARRDLDQYPEVQVRGGRVATIVRHGTDGFAVCLEGGEELAARRVVLATGVSDRFPEVEGFFDHYGASVFHCPTCDGYETSGRTVVVFGWSEHVTGFATTLDGWASSVTVVTDGRRFEGDAEHRRRLEEREIAVIEDDAVSFEGTRGDLRGVRLRGGDVLPCQVAFFSIAHDVNNALAESLGCTLSDEGCVMVDEHGATTVPGVYAAGDLTPGVQLVQVAAAKGAVAGVACAQSLRGEGGMPPWWDGRVKG